MFLQLSYSEEAFQNIIKGQITSKEIEDFFNLKIPSDKTKYYLWLECDRRDPYEGNTINLETLFSPEIEIEHIIPYSICGDDSFLNKTLSFKKFNAKKRDKTPMQYFLDKPDEKRIFEQSIKQFSPAKKERFLMTDDKLEQFRNSQLNNTAYIATEVRKHLLKSYDNKKIELTNGTMTAVVRTLLGFNSILNNSCRVHEVYQNMGKVWAVIDDENEIVDYLERKNDEEPQDLKVIKGVINKIRFYPSKSRDDHRHHAVDALVTAILNEKINTSILKSTEGKVNRITGEFIPKFYENEKGEYKLTKVAIEDIKIKLIKELNLVNPDDLLSIAKRKIENILVSYQNNKLTSLPRKKLFLSNGEPLKDKNGKHLRSSGISVRQDLHEKFYYGKSGKDSEFVRRIKISELTFGQLTRIVDDAIRELVIEKIAEYVITTLTDNSSPARLIDESYKSQERIIEVIKLSVAENEIKEQLETIKDDKSPEAKTQRKDLKQLEIQIKKSLPVKEDYSKLKKAIEKGLKAAIKDGIYLKNEGIRQKKKGTFDPTRSKENIPVRKVRVRFKSNTAIPLKKHSVSAQLTPLASKEIERENYQYIMPGSNYLFVIYGEPEGLTRDKHIVSWFEKAQIDIENQEIKKKYKKEGIKGELIPYYPKKELPVLCELFHNDMVIVYIDSPDEINWNNQTELFNRLFSVIKFTERQLTFARHNISDISKNSQAINMDNLLTGEGVM